MNWLKWLQFVILIGGLPFILIDSMIFLSSFLNLIRMSMSSVSFLIQLDVVPLFLVTPCLIVAVLAWSESQLKKVQIVCTEKDKQISDVKLVEVIRIMAYTDLLTGLHI